MARQAPPPTSSQRSTTLTHRHKGNSATTASTSNTHHNNGVHTRRHLPVGCPCAREGLHCVGQTTDGRCLCTRRTRWTWSPRRTGGPLRAGGTLTACWAQRTWNPWYSLTAAATLSSHSHLRCCVCVCVESFCVYKKPSFLKRFRNLDSDK